MALMTLPAGTARSAALRKPMNSSLALHAAADHDVFQHTFSTANSVGVGSACVPRLRAVRSPAQTARHARLSTERRYFRRVLTCELPRCHCGSLNLAVQHAREICGASRAGGQKRAIFSLPSMAGSRRASVLPICRRQRASSTVRSHPSVVHGIGTRRDRPGRVAELLRRVGLVITGGPGVGKTTVVNSILKILIAKANVGGKPDTTLVVAE